jgi:hypothetical protein
MSYLRYLCLFTHSRIQRILCCVFVCFACLRLVHSMLPVSLHCPFLIVPSVFSNVYFQQINIILLSCIPLLSIVIKTNILQTFMTGLLLIY